MFEDFIETFGKLETKAYHFNQVQVQVKVAPPRPPFLMLNSPSRLSHGVKNTQINFPYHTDSVSQPGIHFKYKKK